MAKSRDGSADGTSRIDKRAADEALDNIVRTLAAARDRMAAEKQQAKDKR